MFGRKKEQKAVQKKPLKKEKQQGEQVKPKKKHWFIKTVIVLLLLSLVGYGGFIYVENVKAQAYIDGGNAAMNLLTQAVKDNGGAAIEINGEAITVSAYYKPIGNDFITANAVAEVVEEETTESTETEEETAEA